MARKARESKGMVMRPNFFVFCEGETEVAYVEMLRAHYRLPIHIIAKKTALNISTESVERCKSAYFQTKNDRTFLMYDLDVPSVLDKLKQITDTVLLCSNPCFELWILLHYENVRSELSSDACLKKLWKIDQLYKKGELSFETRQCLLSNVGTAMERAKRLSSYHNPSSTVFRLIEELDGIKYDGN